MRGRKAHRHRHLRDLRAKMIAETSAFLTWALTADRGLPRIPTRRVDRGGFGRRSGTDRSWTGQWWSTAFERITDCL